MEKRVVQLIESFENMNDEQIVDTLSQLDEDTMCVFEEMIEQIPEPEQE
jgi:hypothetical protein